VGAGATGQVFTVSRLLYRVDASYEHTDAWRDAGARRLNVTPTLTWRINDRSRFTIYQLFNKSDFDGDAGVPVGVIALKGFDLSRRFNTPQDLPIGRIADNSCCTASSFRRSWSFATISFTPHQRHILYR